MAPDTPKGRARSGPRGRLTASPRPLHTGAGRSLSDLAGRLPSACLRSVLPGPFRLAASRSVPSWNVEPWSPTGTGSDRSPPDRGIPLRSVRPDHDCPSGYGRRLVAVPQGFGLSLTLRSGSARWIPTPPQTLPIGGPVPCLPTHTTPGSGCDVPCGGRMSALRSSCELGPSASLCSELTRLGPVVQVALRSAYTSCERAVNHRSQFVPRCIGNPGHSLAVLPC